MARNHPSRYEKKPGEMDEIEALSSALSDDLRARVRAMGAYAPLTPQWCEMVEVLAQLGAVSSMEAQLPKAEAKETLWEGEELALRYVMEDGKLNVCLRNLVDFKKYQREIRTGDKPSLEPESEAKMQKFERGMGKMLRNAWHHIEVLQTTDMPLLINYFSGTLGYAADAPLQMESWVSAVPEPLDLQEVSCIHYFKGVLENLEEMDEERIMSLVRADGAMMALARMLLSCSSYLPPQLLQEGAETLSLLCATEDFKTYQEEYVDPHDEEVFVQLKEGPLAEVTRDYEAKRRIRDLLGFCLSCERRAEKRSSSSKGSRK